MENEERNVSFTLNFDENLNGFVTDKMKQIIYFTSFLNLIKRELEEHGQYVSIRNVKSTIIFDFYGSDKSIDKRFGLLVDSHGGKYDETMFEMNLYKYGEGELTDLNHIMLKCKFGEPPKRLSDFGFSKTIPLARLIEECVDNVIKNWDFEMIES